MKNVIVNADDFGLNANANAAIIESFHKGIINSTTLMANMDGFDEAVELAHQYKLTDKVGAHLVLTEGNPLTDEARLLPYLFNKQNNSQKLFIKKFFALNQTQKRIIFYEYSKQIERVQSKGIMITHLDTHHQIHDMLGITLVLEELLKTYNIPSMRILNNLESTKFYKDFYRASVNAYLKRKRINFTDYLGSREDYLAAINGNPGLTRNKTIEIMVHPIYNSGGKLVDILQKKEYDFEYITKG